MPTLGFISTLKARFPIFILAFFAFLPGLVFATSGSAEPAVIHYFEDRLCPVCQEQKEFMEGLTDEYPDLELNIYSISETEKLAQLAKEYGVEDYRIMAPTSFINGNFLQFNEFGETEKEMVIAAIRNEEVETGGGLSIKIPFTNRSLSAGDLSLPMLTVILGSLDGFNVCSIGALILILSIVLAFDSRKKIFFFGGLFILTTAIVYGVLVFAWGRLFEVLVGQLDILRIVVGLAALTGGIYFFKEFLRFFKHGPSCQTSGSNLIRGASAKLTKTFEDKKAGFLALTGAIVTFAFIVTLVELPCSIGIPIAYSGILVERGVSLTAFILYILAYIFFYMLMEIIVFSGAVLSKKIWFANSKMVTWTTFAGAVVLFYLAFYYLLGN